MRFEDALDDVLGARSRVRVLRVLALAPTGDNLTAREVARRAAISHPQAGRALRWLAGVGVVTERDFGTYSLFDFNHRHVLGAAIRGLFGAEQTAAEDLVAFLGQEVARSSLHVRAAVLFGEIGTRLDLAVLTAPGREWEVSAGIQQLVEAAHRRFGSELHPLIVSRKRAMELVRGGDPAWTGIANGGIPVFRTFPRVR